MTSIQIKSSRIQRILPKSVHINNFVNYHQFIKKGYTSLQALDIEYLNTNHYSDSEGRERMQRRLVKLLRKTKPIKSLHLHKCIIHYESIPDAVTSQIAKKFSRLEALTLPYYVLSKEIIEKYTLWLKNMKNLKSFDYVALAHTDFPDGCLRNFQASLKKFMRAVKHNKIKILNISHNIPDEKIGNLFLNFKDYPSTLTKFSFDWRHFVIDNMALISENRTSLCQMKNLTALSISLRNQMSLAAPILASLPNMAQLTSLDLQLLSQDYENVAFSFDKITGLSKLNKLKLRFDFWPAKLDTFFKALGTCPLNTFSLDVVIEQDNQLIGLKDLIGRLRNLQSLSLKIDKMYAFETKEYFKNLFEKVSRLKALKKLKLHFTSSCDDVEEDLFSSLIPNLRSLFIKSVKLEEFSCRFNQVETKTAFRELVNLVQCTAPSLKKLKIDVGRHILDEVDYRSIIHLVQEFKSIETLEFDSLNVSLNQYTYDFLELVCNLKLLTKLSLGQIKGASTKQPLANILEKLLSKRGFVKFDCSIYYESKEPFTRRNRATPLIDLKKVIKTNSSLENFPRSNFLFSSYNDDTEWKWAQLDTC